MDTGKKRSASLSKGLLQSEELYQVLLSLKSFHFISSYLVWFLKTFYNNVTVCTRD